MTTKTIKFTTITKKDFEFWADGAVTDILWEEMESFCLKEVDSVIDYVIETLVDDYKNKVGIFTPTQGEQQ